MVYHDARLDATFAALADPTRRAIIARLAAGDRTISELASRFDMSLPAVSKHIHVLERAGLARVRREGRARRTALVAAPMRRASEWIERYRRFWEFQLDQLTAYLAATSGDSTGRAAVPLTGDQQRWQRPRNKPTVPKRASKSGALSQQPVSASSTRGRKRKSSTAGARRAR